VTLKTGSDVHVPVCAPGTMTDELHCVICACALALRFGSRDSKLSLLLSIHLLKSALIDSLQ